ncbi:hypothetical protein CC85DRAFT_89436 [Cutaneotrichosporon oleaginosum]|uniref:Secreted protein n=1 Tax=Cutaneotrichosporon oleaginosum TaxID=879819 RepID=A0A0J0XY18_9TREE|nr:uncharacterized protein CC85DRAFT_89436 [Cutaneotrichosporon oleaginosum]KLT45933.1 hypothetical protein CC85DRAFT_89436 [Cutaneotrichosporon oleaginosum]TXT06630.1 hypothetical protein COLE_05961 [Cutaneotrichosporon oleaginosum]
MARTCILATLRCGCAFGQLAALVTGKLGPVDGSAAGGGWRRWEASSWRNVLVSWARQLTLRAPRNGKSDVTRPPLFVSACSPPPHLLLLAVAVLHSRSRSLNSLLGIRNVLFFMLLYCILSLLFASQPALSAVKRSRRASSLPQLPASQS